jgi:hypothetical protein
LSTVQSFNPDRVPGTGAVAADPYFTDPRGAIIDLRTRAPLYGPVGTGSAHVHSAAMSAANGTLAAVSNLIGPKRGQTLLIGAPLNSQATQRALEATTLTQPSFSRSGDEVWVVQNGASKNPEIYQVSTSLTSSGTNGAATASRAKVGAAQLAGKGPVTALTLSPDGVRVAIVAGGKLYLAAIAAPSAATRATPTPATPQPPEALALINLQELRGELDQVGPVAFRSANQILAVSKNPSLSYRSIVDMPIDGSDARPVTSSDLTADVQSMAVSNLGTDADVSEGGDPGSTDPNAGTLYVSVGLPNQVGTILELQGSLSTGQWVSVDPSVSAGVNPFFPT